MISIIILTAVTTNYSNNGWHKCLCPYWTQTSVSLLDTDIWVHQFSLTSRLPEEFQVWREYRNIIMPHSFFCACILYRRIVAKKVIDLSIHPQCCHHKWQQQWVTQISVSLLNTDFCVLIGHRLLCLPVFTYFQRDPKLGGSKEIMQCHIYSSELTFPRIVMKRAIDLSIHPNCWHHKW